MSKQYPYDKATPADRLKVALDIVCRDITHPTIDTCFRLGFTPNDLRQEGLNDNPQPPHILVVKARCSQIIYDAIMGIESE